MTKAVIKTVLDNIKRETNGEYTYNETLVSMKWIPNTHTQPSPFVEIVQSHLGDNFNSRDGGSECEISSNQPRNKKSIQ